MWRGLIEAYRDRLPVGPHTPAITLHEGNTPLLPAPALSARTGCDVYLKVEGANPTGSFKDRGMTVAVSKAVEDGAKAIICASTGNTSASAAAYAARAGLTCAVLVPQGKIALGKLAQALVHGARLLQVDRQLRRLPRARLEALPRLPGRAGQLGQPRPAARPEDRRVRDRRGARRRARHPLPAGRQRRQHHRLLDGLPGGPRGRQRDRSAEDVRLPGHRRRADRDRPGRAASRRRSPPRSGSATRRRGPRRSTPATQSGGLIDAVTDREILSAYRLLARTRRRLRRAGQRGERRRPAAGRPSGPAAGRARPSSARSPATA